MGEQISQFVPLDSSVDTSRVLSFLSVRPTSILSLLDYPNTVDGPQITAATTTPPFIPQPSISMRLLQHHAMGEDSPILSLLSCKAFLVFCWEGDDDALG